MFYKLSRTGVAARTLRRMGAIDFATTVAPGLRDVLLTGKVKEAVTRRRDGRPVYDAVVVDAPPTGRITRFLGVTAEMAQLARSGPIKTQSDGVMAVLKSPQTAVHLVTILEDMPVQETADGIAELRKNDLPVGAVIVKTELHGLVVVAHDGVHTLAPRTRHGVVGDMMPMMDTPEEALAVKREDGSWLLDGLLPIDEMKIKLGIRGLPQEDLGNFHTVGGFVLASLGRIPKKTEKFDWNNWRFEVVDVDRNRVDQVLATPKAGS